MNNLQIVEYNNQRLLTTDQLAEFYGVNPLQIQQNFGNNLDKFIKGQHYFMLEGQELKEFKNRLENFELVGKRAAKLILYTKRGASRHSKMLNTERAWDMYDELEEHYFTPKFQPMTIEDMMIHQLEDMKQVKADIELLKDETVLSSSQRRKIQGMVNSTVIKVLGGKKSAAYKDKSINRTTFSNCYNQLKEVFDVSSYMDIPKIRYDEAMELIPKWRPSLELQARIDQANGNGMLWSEVG